MLASEASVQTLQGLYFEPHFFPLGLAFLSRTVYSILSLQRHVPYFIQVQFCLWYVGIQTSVSYEGLVLKEAPNLTLRMDAKEAQAPFPQVVMVSF